MEYYKAIKFERFILFSSITSDKELDQLENSCETTISCDESNSDIRVDSSGIVHLYEWTSYNIVGLSNAPLNKDDYFYSGLIGRHNSGTILFKNFIGKAKFRDVVFVVESKKMDTHDVEKLISEIDERVQATISQFFSSRGISQGVFKKNKDKFQDFYVYQKLYHSLKQGNITRFAKFIATNPNSQFIKNVTQKHITQIKNVSPESIMDVFSGNTPLSKSNSKPSLSQKFSGNVPLVMNEHINVVTTDINENQFVKFFLKLSLKILSHFILELSERDSENTSKNALLIGELHDYRDAIQQLLKLDFYKNVSNLNLLNHSSTALTKQYGYKQLYNEFINLKQTPTSCFDTSSLIDLFENKSIDKLYEYVSLFRLVDILEKIYSSPSNSTITVASTQKIYTLSLGEDNGSVEFTFKGNDTLYSTKLLFQHSFTLKNNDSYSVEFKPDFTLQVFIGGETKYYHFDSKFRVSYDESSKNDDIVKMHAYRDGITDTVGSFVLFPGQVDNLFIVGDSYPYQGVGSFPLNTDDSFDTILEDALFKIVSRI